MANRLAVILDMHEFGAMGDDPVGNKEVPGLVLAPDRAAVQGRTQRGGLRDPQRAEQDAHAGAVERVPEEGSRSSAEEPRPRGHCRRRTSGTPSRTSELVLPANDRNLIVTVHYYTPMEFTHQGAPWNEATKDQSGVTWNGTDDERRPIDLDFGKAHMGQGARSPDPARRVRRLRQGRHGVARAVHSRVARAAE